MTSLREGGVSGESLAFARMSATVVVYYNALYQNAFGSNKRHRASL